MTSVLKQWRMVGVGACCAAAGIGAGAVATAGASTSGSSPSTAKHAGHRHAGDKRGGARALARRAVHGSVVVHAKGGFRTVTWDRGTVSAVNGDQITLAEGTPTATYRKVTLTIPSGARIRDNRAKATLASVKPGQRAIVIRRPKRTVVVAHTPKAHRSS